MTAVPLVLGVNVTLQVPATKVQETVLNVPVTPDTVNDTVPVGVDVGAGEVSVTVTVQVVGWFTTTLVGVQLTTVEVVRGVTVNGNVPTLPL